jgi:integrase
MRDLEYNFTYREKDKGFQVILSYKDNKGRWRQKSRQGFKTKKLAKAAGDKLLDEVKEKALNVLDESMKDITLRQVFELFLLENNAVLEYNTRALYTQALQAFIKIADIPVVEITHSDIIDSMSPMKYAVSTKNLYLSKVGRVFRYAIETLEILAANPVSKVPKEKDKRQKKTQVISADDFKIMLKSVRQKNYTAYVKIAIAGYAGLRYGEIVGLTWGNVDLKAGIISVTAQLSATGKNQYTIKPTKSMNGYRDIPIPQELIQILRAYKKNSVIRIDRRIFADKTSEAKYIDALISRINKGTSIHSLRHTYATRLIATGFDVRTVAALLGDRVETVLKTYVHYTDEMREKAKENINKVFA